MNSLRDQNDLLESADDSFYLEFQWSPFHAYSHTSLRLPKRHTSTCPNRIHHGDFISLVTGISRAYQRDRYMDMQVLDEVKWQEFGAGGSSFQISEATIALNTASSFIFKQPVEVKSRIVIKKTRNWSMTGDDVRSFNRELRILDHLHDSGNIVKLHGIGWFIDEDPAQRVPVPSFLFEQADFTLRHMISRDADIPIKTMLSKFSVC